MPVEISLNSCDSHVSAGWCLQQWSMTAYETKRNQVRRYYSCETKRNQLWGYCSLRNQTKLNQTKPNQTNQNGCHFGCHFLLTSAGATVVCETKRNQVRGYCSLRNETKPNQTKRNQPNRVSRKLRHETSDLENSDPLRNDQY